VESRRQCAAREVLMLAFNFDYYLPDTLQEAVDIYASVQQEGKTPLYYGGGTEIISMGRVFNVIPDAVIDIKKIPECCGLGTDGIQFEFGSAVTLSAIYESGIFPLLGLAAGRIADHTVQCKLTLGGNLAGTIHYHETLLPLMLADSTIHIASPQGVRQAAIVDVLSSGKKLAPGECIIKVSLNQEYASYPYAHIKKSKAEKIGYPLISLSALNVNGILRLAASGLCAYPFRFNDIPIDNDQPAYEITQQLQQSIPDAVLDDIEGSPGYRLFCFQKTVEKIIKGFREHKGKNNA
jgi:CO/xanthine dehydrogenase FAD-binding subunit